jgi:hypothetical protein
MGKRVGHREGITMDKYEAPELEEFGTVTDLTETGLTRPGTDVKSGSILHSSGR